MYITPIMRQHLSIPQNVCNTIFACSSHFLIFGLQICLQIYAFAYLVLFTYTEVAMTQHLCQGSCHPTGGDVRYCYLPVSDRQIIWTWGWRIVVCFMGLAKSHHLIGLLSNRNTVNMVEWHQQFLVWFTLPSVSSFFTTVSLFDLRSLAPRWYDEYLKA